MEELEVLEKPKQKELTRLLTPSGPQNLAVVAIPGETVQQLVNRGIPEELRGYIVAFNNGARITELENFYIREDDNILLALVPQGGGGGGKGILGAVLMVAVMVMAPYVAGAMAGAGMLGSTALAASIMGTTSFAITAATMAIGMVGMMAISALIPPPSVNQTGGGFNAQAQSPTYSLSGQSNAAKKYGTVAKIYGRHKYFPMLAANPVIANLGSESRISALYDFGIGNVKLSDIKIGDTDASNFAPEFETHTNSLVKTTKFVTSRVGYDQFTYGLNTAGSTITVKTKTGTVGFDIDLSFQRGLFRYEPSGATSTNSIALTIEYRLVGSPTWINIDASHIFGMSAFNQLGNPGGNIAIGGHYPKPSVAVASVTGLPIGTYEVRITRPFAPSNDPKYFGEMNLSLVKSYQDGVVVNLDKPHTMLEMKLLASDKVSGVVQNLSAICTSVLRTTTDGVTFVDQESRNPAWIVLDILTGSASKKPLQDSLIDWPSFIKLAKYCEDNKHYVDCVVDYATTVKDLIDSVLSVAHTSMRFTSAGKYGVLIDEEQTIPRQIITPTNSWGFSGGRTFADLPHAFLVTFINGWDAKLNSGNTPSVSWQKDERIVYADGYDETNATKFETLQTFGITDSDQAWRYGRYMMAQGIHRSETFTVTMDVENLVVQRGDLVHVAHDVPKIGGMACRVVSVNGNDIEVDQALSILVNGYSVRLDDGTVRTGAVTGFPGVANHYILDNAAGIHVDDVIVLGEVNRVVGKYIVQSINAGANLTAELQMVKYVPEVYQADKGNIPPWDPEMSQDAINSSTLAIDTVTATQKLIYIDRKPLANIKLDWSVLGWGYSKGNVYVQEPGGTSVFVGTVDGTTFEYPVNLITRPDLVGKDLIFEVFPLTASGIAGTSGKVTVAPLGDTEKPKTPIGFAVNVQSETINCMWSKPPEPDVIEYQLRYSPDVSSAAYWDGAQHLATVPYTSTQVAVGARTGTYFIRALDSSGNMSDAAVQRTTVQTLPNVEQVTDIDDRLNGWKGQHYNLVVRKVNRNMMMAEWTKLSQVSTLDAIGAGLGDLMSSGNWGAVSPISYYVFENPVDLNGVYEVRVSSMIEVHGEDINNNTVSADLWDAWLEYRVTSNDEFMSDWTTLSSVADLIGSSSPWSEWRHIAVGDITGKLVQFRIQMRAYDPNVKVVLTDGSVIIDAVDRIWSLKDIAVETAGHLVNFDPPFMFDDIAVAVSVDGANQALFPDISAKSRTGCTITLIDPAGKPSAGKVDLIVRGQGKQRTQPI